MKRLQRLVIPPPSTENLAIVSLDSPTSPTSPTSLTSLPLTKTNTEATRVDPQSVKFSDLKISTMTMVIATNWNLDIAEIFTQFPITEFIVVRKKRGRKKKGPVIDPNEGVLSGSVICLEYSGERRGPDLKPDKTSRNIKNKKKTKPFRNSISVVMKVGNKYVNGKISNNGKIQITGAKKLEHTISFINNIWRLIRSLTSKGKMTYTLKNDDTVPKAVVKIVMTNIDYDLGYNIDRLKIDSYIKTEQARFISIFHPSSAYSGVNIKAVSKDYIDNRMTLMTWDDTNELSTERCPYDQYVALLSEKDKVKEATPKDHYHTFLVFYSGRVIQSGPSYQDMEKVREQFVELCCKQKDTFMEKRT